MTALKKKDIRINFIGGSGVGKTTLAKAVALKIGCPHFDSDDYFHVPTDPPFRQQRSPDERKALLEKDLGPHSSWTLSGGAAVWNPTPKLEFSLIVFIRLDPATRTERLKKREFELYGSRILAGGDMAEDHQSFMDWTSGYDSGAAEGTNTLPEHERYLASANAPVLRLDGLLTTEEQVQMILKVIT